MASRTGTASQIDASAASGSTSVTVPADCTAAVAFWAGFDAAASTLSTLTLGGNSFTTQSEKTTQTPADTTGTGVATLTNLPGTGTQTLAWAWSNASARDEGGGLVIVWAKSVNTADLVRDADTDHDTGSTIPSVTIDSTTTDLVLAMGQRFGDPDPILNADVVFVNNMNVNSEGYDVGEYSPPGASNTTATIAAPDYSTVAAISLKDGAVPPAVTGTTNPFPVRHSRETSW